MNKFLMNENKNYIIYGAGGNSYRVIKLLQSNQYKVSAILDMRAKDIHDIIDIPIYTLSDFAKLNLEKEQCVILITIKNVFEHVNIVRELITLGYENIIYKPYPILQGEHNEEWDSIDKAYETLIENNQFLENGQKLIAKSKSKHLIVFKEDLLIERKNEVICWLPVELLCNYNREDAFQLIPMGAFYPILEIYDYLLNNQIFSDWDIIKENFLLYSSDWVERTGKDYTDSLKNSLIQSRIDIFGEMQKKFDIDKFFFINNAVSVKRKKGEVFYLSSSGRNRVSFMIAKGNRYIPVKMSIDDYLQWLNSIEFQNFKIFLEEKRINKLFTSIPHPMLAVYATDTIDYVHLFCMPIIKEIYKYIHKNSIVKDKSYERIDYKKYIENKKNISIGIAMKDDGCLARLLRIYGFNTIRLALDSIQNEISTKIDQLLQLPKERENQISLLEDEMTVKSKILILDSRVSSSVLNKFKGEKIFWLQWENDKLDQSIEKRYTRKKRFFSSIWMKKEVFGWIVEK